MEQSTLFKTTKQLSPKEKLIKSRKATTDLTKEIIQWLNDSGQFIAWRQNNIPSTRTEVIIKPDGTKDTKFHFKKNNVTFKLLDIAAIQIETGIYCEFELKKGADKLSEGQKERIRSLKAANAICFAFYDKETFMHQIKPFVREREPAF